MSTQTTLAVKTTRKAFYDEVGAQIHAFEAQLATLKAKAQSARADAELAAIANLGTAKRALDQKVAELTREGETAFRQVKADVDAGVAEFDKMLQAIASRLHAR